METLKENCHLRDYACTGYSIKIAVEVIRNQDTVVGLDDSRNDVTSQRTRFFYVGCYARCIEMGMYRSAPTVDKWTHSYVQAVLRTVTYPLI